MGQACEDTRLHESKYVERRKELLSLVNQLHSIGAQDVIDLPRITVIGKQSAGKSSVVEAISGIKVPRDAGTCTRCPLECRLQSTPPGTLWSCQVFIRWESTVNGIHAREPEVKFGPVISDKSKVEETLRRAQFACLHPSSSPEQALGMNEGDLRVLGAVNGVEEMTLPENKKKVNFSRNVVCVDIQGPGLPDLSFIDLPGLIQNAEPEDVQLVEDLVMSNIQGNCLILVAMPVTDDIENQKALRLAQRVDPYGRRTIGVLTKPDLLAPSSTNARQMWIDIIEGRKHTLKHGYYCVRQPDDSEREAGITTVEAREAEGRFFASSEAWRNLNEKTKCRLGTDRLIDMVGELLVQVINDSLPRIREEAAQNLAACKRDLQALPPVLETDPSTYMLTVLTSLTNDFSELVRGGPNNSRLIHGNREAFEAFKKKIRGTSPQFLAKPHSDTSGMAARRAGTNCEELIWNGEGFTLDDMRRHIERSVTRELRGNVPYQAKVSLIVAYQKHWPNHVLECYDRVRMLVAEVLDGCVKHNFEQHERMLEPLRTYVDELIQDQYTKCLEFLQASLEIERTPFTQNDHYLDSSAEKWLAKYRDERAGSRDKSSQIPAVNGIPTSSTSVTGIKPIAPPRPQSGASSSQSAAQDSLPAFGNPVADASGSPKKFGSFGPTPGTAGRPSTFGASAAQSQANSQNSFSTTPQIIFTGSLKPPYTAYSEPDPSNKSLILQYQSMSCMPAYEDFTVEEIRVQDYKQGRKTASAFGQYAAFGSSQPTPTNLFNQTVQQNQTSSFGNTGTTTSGGFGGSGAFNSITQPGASPSSGAPTSVTPAKSKKKHKVKNNDPVTSFVALDIDNAGPSSTPASSSQSFVAPQTPLLGTQAAHKNTEKFAFSPPTPPEKDQDKVKEALAKLASLGYTGLTEEDLGKLNPADEYETELKVMAEVRGYFQVSYKRIIDNIPSLIDLKFVRAIGKELQPFLISRFELGTINGNTRCAAYLAEHPDVSEKRAQLLVRKKRLENVQTKLLNFGR